MRAGVLLEPWSLQRNQLWTPSFSQAKQPWLMAFRGDSRWYVTSRWCLLFGRLVTHFRQIFHAAYFWYPFGSMAMTTGSQWDDWTICVFFCGNSSWTTYGDDFPVRLSGASLQIFLVLVRDFQMMVSEVWATSAGNWLSTMAICHL